jgi:hypothetical protein
LYHDLLRCRELFERLLEIDRLTAADVQIGGCACGGRLDRASYRRKARGLAEGLDPGHTMRESFCCCRDGCRKRATPVSVRFLGRRVYVSVVVIVAAAVEGGVSKRRLEVLRDLMRCPLDRRTVERWVAWWRTTLPRMTFWRGIRGRLRTPVDPERMPLSLLEAFRGKGPQEAVIDMLQLLAPISIGHAL